MKCICHGHKFNHAFYDTVEIGELILSLNHSIDFNVKQDFSVHRCSSVVQLTTLLLAHLLNPFTDPFDIEKR